MSDSTVFRFKFSNEFIDELQSFAKIYQYSDRSTYKEQWNLWVQNNDELIDSECRRLKTIGYDGNIIDKMYRSGRYYFRNKNTTLKEPKQRRKYVSIDCEIIESMDNYIKEYVLVDNSTIKPSELYNSFCESHKSSITDEIERLKQMELSNNDIIVKFKKTFKNRYFIYQQNNNNNNNNNREDIIENELNKHTDIDKTNSCDISNTIPCKKE